MADNAFRMAWRSMARMPGLAAVVIISLGIGIGVNTAVFSWIEAIVFRPLPGVDDAAHVMLIDPVSDSGLRPGSSWQEYRDVRQRVPSLRNLAAYRMVPF